MQNAISPQPAEQTLAAYLSGGRLPHALLVEGPPGERRENLVRTAVMGALCAAETGPRPCGACRDCVKVNKGIHPDLLVFSGEGGSRSFHVDTVRSLRQQAYIRPNEAVAKVLLLESAQDMSAQAQNALLKIIEEPPAGVYFILTCENRAALLETVRSRVAVLSLDAHQAGDQDSKAMDILYNACIGSELDALAALAPLERDRPALAALLEEMRTSASLLLLGSAARERTERLARRAGPLRLYKILGIIEDTQELVTRNAGGLLVVTSLCARIRSVMAET